MKTLGQIIREARNSRDLTLREVTQKITKPNGTALSSQYLHDIEYDKRSPSHEVLSAIATILDLPIDVLLVAAGRVPDEVRSYLVEHRDQAPEVAAFFARAKNQGFVEWRGLLQ